MDFVNVSRRLTHTYTGTFAHLDKWEGIGVVSVTPSKQVDEPEEEWRDLSHGGRYIRWARLPAGLSKAQRKQWSRGLMESLTREGCHHEWDCCGCPSHYTRVVHRKGRDITLLTTVSYNY